MAKGKLYEGKEERKKDELKIDNKEKGCGDNTCNLRKGGRRKSVIMGNE